MSQVSGDCKTGQVSSNGLKLELVNIINYDVFHLVTFWMFTLHSLHPTKDGVEKYLNSVIVLIR